jgi:hypothetical protein
MACSIFIGGPDYPDAPIPYSPTAVESFNSQLDQALTASAETGTITLQFTEEQITSFLILKMQSQENPPFTDPQVLLRNGQMQILGKVAQGIFTANMAIILNVSVDETGMPKIEVASADFGPFPAPEGLNSAISAVVAEAFTGSFGPAATGIRIETISIADGVITFTGRIK